MQQPNQDIQQNNLEYIFVAGIDSTVTESEIAELFKFTTGGDVVVSFQKFLLKEQEKVLTKVQLSKENAVMAHSKLNGQKIKDCVMKLIPQNCMKQIVVMGLPLVFSEKDLFLILNSKSKGLKNIIVADDPQDVGKTQGLAVAIYKSYEEANIALQTLNNMTIMQKEVQCYWKEPEEDIVKQMSLESRCIYISNLSYQSNEDSIATTLKEFGTINRIKHYINKAFVEFDSVNSAKRAFQAMNQKRVDGKVWDIYPARKENTMLVRDGAEKNIVYSIEFMGNNQDKQSLIRMGITGQLPDVNPIVQQKANQILQHVKQMQQNQLNMLKTQVENQKNLNQQNFSNFGQQNNNNNNNKKNNNNKMNNNNNNNNMNMNNNNNNMNMNMGNNNSNNFNMNMNNNSNNNMNNNNNMGMNNNNMNMGNNMNNMNNQQNADSNANNQSNSFGNNENSNQNLGNIQQQQMQSNNNMNISCQPNNNNFGNNNNNMMNNQGFQNNQSLPNPNPSQVQNNNNNGINNNNNGFGNNNQMVIEQNN